jgi:hypothetical protein
MFRARSLSSFGCSPPRCAGSFLGNRIGSILKSNLAERFVHKLDFSWTPPIRNYFSGIGDRNRSREVDRRKKHVWSVQNASRRCVGRGFSVERTRCECKSLSRPCIERRTLRRSADRRPQRCRAMGLFRRRRTHYAQRHGGNAGKLKRLIMSPYKTTGRAAGHFVSR